MRYLLVVMLLSLSPLLSAQAQISIQIGLPSVSIGFSQPYYPELVAVPGYPVYYDPNADSNYFFYDGMYWVYEGDNWYASDWYNGPWSLVGPEYVPLFILRVPVSYYRRPPAYFIGWQASTAPRWGDHWGHDWERQRGGWDQWDRRAAPAPAPLPVYQKQYSGNRYPRGEEQRTLHTQNYRHEPREAAVKEIRRAQAPSPSARPANQPAPHAEPAREAPHAQPAREAPHAQPAREAPHAQPARETPHAQPAREAPHAQPARETPRAEPAREAPHAEPTREAPHAQPAREAPRAQPTREAPRAEPAREAPHAQPAREAPHAQPAREAPRGQPKGEEKGRE